MQMDESIFESLCRFVRPYLSATQASVVAAGVRKNGTLTGPWIIWFTDRFSDPYAEINASHWFANASVSNACEVVFFIQKEDVHDNGKEKELLGRLRELAKEAYPSIEIPCCVLFSRDEWIRIE